MLGILESTSFKAAWHILFIQNIILPYSDREINLPKGSEINEKVFIILQSYIQMCSHFVEFFNLV